MFCTKCGAPLLDGAKFCVKCGNPVAQPVVKPVEEPVVKPTEEPVVKPAEEPVVKPAEEPVVTPAEEPVVTPTEEPVRTVIAEPVQTVKYVSEPATPDKKADKAQKKTVRAEKKATKAARKAEKAAKKAAKEAKKANKKKHTGLKVVLVIFIFLVLLAGAAGVCWHFVIPQSTKDYIFLQRELMNKEYSTAAEHFVFSDKDLAKDKDGFIEYIRDNFRSGCELKDLLDANYVLKTSDGEKDLTYDDKAGKFGGDQFTYSFKVLEPKLALGKGGSLDDPYVESTVSGFLSDECTYEFNAILGDDLTEKTNNVEVTLSIKNGEIDDIEDVCAEADDVDPEEFVSVEDGKLIFGKLLVDDEYVKRLADNYCEFITDFSPSAKKGVSTEDFLKKYKGTIVTENYYTDYDNFLQEKSILQLMEYNIDLTNESIEPVGVFDVNDSCFIFTGSFLNKVSMYGETEENHQNSYLIVRPYDSIGQVVFNADSYEKMEYYNDRLDEGMDYFEALDELLKYIGADAVVEEEFINDVRENDGKYDLTDEIIGEYSKALGKFSKAGEGTSEVKFKLANIGEKYPLMVCITGDSHADSAKVFIYDEKKKQVVDLGYYGEFGQFSYIPGAHIIYTSGGGMGYYYEGFYEVSGSDVKTLGVFAEDTNQTPSVFYIDDKETTDKNYLSERNNLYNNYPMEAVESIYYSECYEVNEDYFEQVFEECTR